VTVNWLPLIASGTDTGRDQDDIAARVARECAEQGIPSKLEDAVIISRILTLMNVGRNSGARMVLRDPHHADRVWIETSTGLRKGQDPDPFDQ
jgi:hypothetical protein